MSHACQILTFDIRTTMEKWIRTHVRKRSLNLVRVRSTYGFRSRVRMRMLIFNLVVFLLLILMEKYRKLVELCFAVNRYGNALIFDFSKGKWEYVG